MSNHNYSQYSNHKKHKNTNNYNRDAAHVDPVSPKVEAVPETPKPVVENVIPMVETVETVTLPKTVEGFVTGCAKLNVRANPSTISDVVCVLDAMSELEVDVEKSNNEWFHICTATGIEGYCMRRFIEAHL